MSTRLPIPGQDTNTWGDILNNYLLVAHSNDGTLSTGSVGTAQLSNGSVTESKLHPDVVTRLQSVGITPEDKAKLDNLAEVATSGDYEDLDNIPTTIVHTDNLRLPILLTQTEYDSLPGGPVAGQVYIITEA